MPKRSAMDNYKTTQVTMPKVHYVHVPDQVLNEFACNHLYVLNHSSLGFSIATSAASGKAAGWVCIKKRNFRSVPCKFLK